MKKLYILFFIITPLFVYGQQCDHEHERGEHHHIANDFHPIQTQNRVFNTIPYTNSFENGFGDITLVQNGSTAYNWVINAGHFVLDDDAQKIADEAAKSNLCIPIGEGENCW